MKNNIRMRIATDMLLQKREQFLINILVLVAAMTFVGIVTNLFVDANFFHMTLRDGLAIDESRLGTISFDFDMDNDTCNEMFIEIKNLKEIKGLGEYTNTYGNSFNALSFIGDYQGKIWTLDDTHTGHIKELWMSDSLWEILPLKLYDGKPPSQWECDDTLIYLGYSFKDIVRAGDVYEELVRGEVYKTFRVGGILAEGSCFLNGSAQDEVQQNVTGSLVADNWMIEIFDEEVLTTNQQWFYISETADKEMVKEKILNIADKYDTSLRVVWFEDVIEGIDMQNRVINAYLWDIALLLGISAVILIICSQVISMLVRADEYGIWYSCGATNKDMVLILIYQNLRRMILPVIIGAAINYIILYKQYYVIRTDLIMINRIFWTVEVPVMMLLAIVITAICSAVSIYVLTRKQPMEMLKGEV